MSAIPVPASAAGQGGGIASPDSQMEQAGNWMTIGPNSPMFKYESQSNVSGTGWSEDSADSRGCSPASGMVYAVGIDDLYGSDMTFLWDSGSQCTISVGLDGQLQNAQAGTGSFNLNAQAGNHALRLEVSNCPASGDDMTFQFLGLKVNTAGSDGAGTSSNTTIDDADPLVQYSGFKSTPVAQSQIPDFQNGAFYQNTVSYTSSAQAAASLAFPGPAIYIYGPTGPSFGTYQVALDSAPSGTFNASTAIPAFNTLLFYANQLDTTRNHHITITNQIEGATLAIDYFVIASLGGTSQQPFWPGDQSATRGNDSTGALVGGILGGLVAALLLFLAFMYWRYRKKGGKGNFWTAFCGPIRKALKVEKKEESQFRPWPMLLYRPKYAVSD